MGPALRLIARTVLAVGVFFLGWAYCATLLFDGPSFVATGQVVPYVVVPAAGLASLAVGLGLVGGIVVPRRPRAGLVVLGIVGAANGALGLPILPGEGGWSFTGVLLLVVGATIALGAAGLLAIPTPVVPRSGFAAERAPELHERTAAETNLAWSVGIAGVLLLICALLELVRRLAELPGASEHWAGDITFWLATVLPLPIAVGSVALVAGRWFAHRSIGPGHAVVLWLVLVLGGVAWLVFADLSAAAGGGSFRPLEDPLLWYPDAAILGSIFGAVAAGISELGKRRSAT